MFVELAILILSMALIVASSELFTNSVEWLGQRFSFSEGVVGSVFAAIGTALPETFVPLIAVLSFGDQQGNEVSVGAINGSPFMLSTLTFGLCGLFIWIFSKRGRRELALNLDTRVLRRDLGFFIGAFSLVLLLSFIPLDASIRMVLGCLIILLYPVYLIRSFRAEGEVGEEPDALYLARPFKWSSKNSALIVSQIVLSLLGIVCGAYFFVGEIQDISVALGFPAQVLAIMISPVATEFPEKMNSILWIRKGKDTMALGNVTGALVFQGTILGGFGVAFTKWNLGLDAKVSAAIAIVSALAVLILLLKNRLTYKVLALGVITYLVCITSFILAK